MSREPPTTPSRARAALRDLPRRLSVRVALVVLVVLGVTVMVWQYQRAAGTLGKIAAVCREASAAECRDAAQAGEARVVRDGPSVLGTPRPQGSLGPGV